MSPWVESSVMVDVHWHQNNQHALEKLVAVVPRQRVSPHVSAPSFALRRRPTHPFTAAGPPPSI